MPDIAGVLHCNPALQVRTSPTLQKFRHADTGRASIWISLQRRIDVTFRTRHVAVFKLIVRPFRKTHGNAPPDAAGDDDRYASMRSRQAGYNCN
jgi:hypothetical protein